MRKDLLYFLLVVFIVTACGEERNMEVITIKRKDLIPEGIAIGSDESIYLTSINTKNILRSNPDGSQPRNLDVPYGGTHDGLGMVIKDGILYALRNNSDSLFTAALQLIDLETEKQIASYELTDTTESFFNDMAITSDGRIYITNTMKSAIYTIENDNLTLFIESAVEYPNGITLSSDERFLYVAAFFDGIRVIDLTTKEVLNQPDTVGLTRGIDGLKYFQNSLIAIQNGFLDRTDHSIVRYYLEADGISILSVDTLVNDHEVFRIPTTFDIRNGWIYCLANSQLDNLHDDGYLVDEEELTDTYILKLKID